MLPYTGPVKQGEVWKTASRKGALTIRVLEDVDQSEDTFFSAEVVHGRARFLSEAYTTAQRFEGYGCAGSVMSFRTTLTTFIEKVGFIAVESDEVIREDPDPRLPA